MTPADPASPHAPAPSGPSPSLRARIPNLLTILRVVLAAAFVALLTVWSSDRLTTGPLPDPWLLAAAALFVIAAVTDALDGHLARKWDVVSRFGRVMDPFADKILVLGAFVMLAGPSFASPVSPDVGRAAQLSGVLPWMAVLILARELLVTSIRAVLEGEGKDFSAAWSGKIKMILQAIAVPIVLVLVAMGVPEPGSARRWAIDLTVWATVAATIASGIPYVTRALGMQRG